MGMKPKNGTVVGILDPGPYLSYNRRGLQWFIVDTLMANGGCETPHITVGAPLRTDNLGILGCVHGMIWFDNLETILKITILNGNTHYFHGNFQSLCNSRYHRVDAVIQQGR